MEDSALKIVRSRFAWFWPNIVIWSIKMRSMIEKKTHFFELSFWFGEIIKEIIPLISLAVMIKFFYVFNERERINFT